MQDSELIILTQKGDEQAFCDLIKKYEKKIYSIAYKFMRNEHDAQDAAQDAIIKMFINIKKFSFQSAFTTWMYRVTANACLDALRKRSPAANFEEFERLAVSADGNPSADLLNRELGEAIRKAVQLLPEKHIPIIVLRDMEGLKYEEIAEVLKISVGTVKSRIFRAREKLREILISQNML